MRSYNNGGGGAKLGVGPKAPRLYLYSYRAILFTRDDTRRETPLCTVVGHISHHPPRRRLPRTGRHGSCALDADMVCPSSGPDGLQLSARPVCTLPPVSRPRKPRDTGHGSSCERARERAMERAQSAQSAPAGLVPLQGSSQQHESCADGRRPKQMRERRRRRRERRGRLRRLARPFSLLQGGRRRQRRHRRRRLERASLRLARPRCGGVKRESAAGADRGGGRGGGCEGRGVALGLLLRQVERQALLLLRALRLG